MTSGSSNSTSKGALPNRELWQKRGSASGQKRSPRTSSRVDACYYELCIFTSGTHAPCSPPPCFWGAGAEYLQRTLTNTTHCITVSQGQLALSLCSLCTCSAITLQKGGGKERGGETKQRKGGRSMNTWQTSERNMTREFVFC